MREDFGILILTHGRPDTVAHTINTLERVNYTGKWWLVLDDGDTTHDEYVEKWGADQVITFVKADVPVDIGDNHPVAGAVVYARNATDQIATDLGLTYYMVFDDDYNTLGHRWAENGQLRGLETRRFDAVVDALIEFLEVSDAETVAFGQGGDYIGGINNPFYWQGLTRKAMNSFLIRTGRPLPFKGRINEDVTMYVMLGMTGRLVFTVTDFYLVQAATQGTEGGLTTIYLDLGTYIKSFYSVMYAPSCVKIGMMGPTEQRIHHRVQWSQAIPKILSDRWRKPVSPSSKDHQRTSVE